MFRALIIGVGSICAIIVVIVLVQSAGNVSASNLPFNLPQISLFGSSEKEEAFNTLEQNQWQTSEVEIPALQRRLVAVEKDISNLEHNNKRALSQAIRANDTLAEVLQQLAALQAENKRLREELAELGASDL